MQVSVTREHAEDALLAAIAVTASGWAWMSVSSFFFGAAYVNPIISIAALLFTVVGFAGSSVVVYLWLLGLTERFIRDRD